MNKIDKLTIYYKVDIFGNVSDFCLDLSGTFRYHGQDIPLYSDFIEEQDFVKVVENYGPGAVECILYKNKRFAELIGTEIKYKKLVAKIKNLEKSCESL